MPELMCLVRRTQSHAAHVCFRIPISMAIFSDGPGCSASSAECLQPGTDLRGDVGAVELSQRRLMGQGV